jgi:predicted DsbA family dithiol-disulfide isomerase
MTSPVSAPTIEIDIASDIVCPWCVIGWKQLDRAIKQTGIAAQVRWHPFELNPGMGPEGQNIREHVAEKYGSTPEDSAKARAHIAALGDQLGVTFAFDENSRIYNTFDAHRLLHWAGTQGLGHQLKLALFTAYFTDRRNVSDRAVLVDVAKAVGFDAADVEKVLADGLFAEEVRKGEQFWHENGVSGVPAMVFQRKHLVTGAQGEDRYADILRQVAAQIAAEPATKPAT